ncbi:MAG: hypothetical protein ACM3OH_03495 [Bacillota bacterium]|jgi:hypothetical protein
MTPRRPRALAVPVLFLAALCVAPPAVAQRVTIAPTIGVYIPTEEFYKAATSGNSADLRKQEVSIGLGGRLGIVGRRVGVEFTGEYAPSKLKFDLNGQQSQEDANVLTGSGRLTLFVIPTSSPIWFAVSGGVGVVHRSGAAYATLTDRTDLAPTAGAQAGFHLGRLIALTVSADGYFYKPDFSSTGTSGSTSQITQKDIHLSAGVSIPFLGVGR